MQMDVSFVTKSIGLPLLAYLLGSIPWGILITPFFSSKDIRRQGSGNIGATNVRRVAGSKAGALVLAGDILKGALPVYLASLLVSPTHVPGQLYTALVVMAAFCGHLYPLYLGFKSGGKGVATALGCLLVISPVTAAITLLVFILMVCISNRVSIGSLSGAAVLPLIMWKSTDSWIMTLCTLAISLFVYLRHRDNIVRLINGTESVVWKK
jgi:glycerol-3-phosphate acyltransferase PlsY